MGGVEEGGGTVGREDVAAEGGIVRGLVVVFFS